ncbi:MAG: von Willebrand factor type A domain-containing protein [Pseudomonadota bacterium]
MTRSAFQRSVAAMMAFSLTAPMGPSVALAQSNGPAAERDKPGDGVVSAAACAPFGFRVAERSPQPVPVAGGAMSRAYPGPPPPAPMPLPPPPPPPPPPRLQARAPTEQSVSVDEIVVSGSRVPATSANAPAPVTVYGLAGPAVIAPSPAPTENTSSYPDATPNPVRRTSDMPVSTFSIDVDTAAYANVRGMIEDGDTPPADAVRVEEMINYFDYGYERPTSASRPFAVTTAVAAAPWAPGRQIVHIGLQGYELPAAERRPLNLTFLVDVSGSMDDPDKLGLAQKAMNLIIDRLRPEDTLAITYYASTEGTTIAPTRGDHKLQLRCAVASLSANGATAGARGMVNAYEQAEANFARDRVNRILMFTDGDFNVGTTDNQRLEDFVAGKRATGIYLSVYGFGQDNYQEDRMQAIAQAGNGVAGYVDDLAEARRLFGPRFDRGAFPIADDVKIQVEFNPARVAEWRLIGYETRLLNEEDFANDRVDAGEVGSGASVTALYEITPVGGPTQMGERRYPDNRIGVGGGDPSGEVGFVQIRYKLPGESESQLISQVVSNAGQPGRVSAQPPESTRWAMAVAAFGQKLRGDPWMSPDYGWDQVLEQAQGARGEDPYGDRAEFVQLVRAAQGLPARTEP